jgi:RNA polymerase sigma-70 factor (ECF subfamily)
VATHPTIDFESLVAQWYEPLYKFAYSLSKSESDAADLTQQTFLIWAKKGDSLRESSKVKSWLFTTLYREFLRSARRGKQSTAVDQEILEAKEDPNSIASVRSIEAQEAINALHRLDPVYREPLILFYLEDLAYKEISEILDIPMGTVMSRLSRGKKQLRAALSENS